MQPTITYRRESPDSSAAVLLIADLDKDLIENYGVNKIFGVKAADLVPGAMVFLVVYVDETPAGCGALRFMDDSTAELKRMFVAHAFRGMGLGRGLLRALTAEAQSANIQRLLLETRAIQEAAVGLYRSEGWQPIECYGEYADNPTSICFEKYLC